MSTSETQIPLTDDERQTLTRQRSGVLKVLVMVCVLAVVLLLVLVFFHPLYVLVFFSVFLLTLLVVAVTWLSRLRKLSRDLQAGQKQIISGPVEAQNIDVSRQTNSNGEAGDASYRFWIQVKGKKITVSEDQYYQFKKGDLVEAFVAPNSQTVLSVNKEFLNRPFG
jgi:ABC-type transport system involved in cytochrome bd biosynthesis fused ATPase/permease subunit